jgi:hypothetical protein
MKRLCVVIAIAGASLAAASTAAAVSDFATSRGAAYCGASEGEPPLRLICWRPRDGLTLDMTRRGSVQIHLNKRNRGYHDLAPGRVLRDGQAWSRPGYWKCVSRPKGLTCTNRAGHGWWLGRIRGSRSF